MRNRYGGRNLILMRRSSSHIFELNTVLNEGVFWTANQLFGIKFVERFDIPVYHPDVRVWEIFRS
ncbi:M3 family metallopeptidase [Escherichia coli]